VVNDAIHFLFAVKGGFDKIVDIVLELVLLGSADNGLLLKGHRREKSNINIHFLYPHFYRGL